MTTNQAQPPNEIAVGTQLEPWRRPADFPMWNRYAAVNYEFIDIHMEDAAGQAAGFEAAIGMGNLTLAYMHNAVCDWLGDRGELVAFRVQFRAPAVRGREIVVRCEVTGVEETDDGVVVELSVLASDDFGVEIANGGARALVDQR